MPRDTYTEFKRMKKGIKKGQIQNHLFVNNSSVIPNAECLMKQLSHSSQVTNSIITQSQICTHWLDIFA